MANANQAPGGGERLRYRLTLEGELAGEWVEWFGADRSTTRSGCTELELTVEDQAALHGVLRRVHDLHLRLITLTRVDDNQ